METVFPFRSPNALYGAQSAFVVPPAPAVELELLELPHAASTTPAAANPTTTAADLCLRTPMGSASLKGRLSGFGRPSTGPSSRDVSPAWRPCATESGARMRNDCATLRPACSPRKGPSIDPHHRRLRRPGQPPPDVFADP